MWLVAAASGSEFHAGPSQAMHWISLEGEGAVVSVRSGRVPQRRAHGGARKRKPTEARASASARERGSERAVQRERESARAPVTLRQTTSSNDLKLTCAVFQMRRSPAPSPVLKRSWLNWHSD
jgi:hypothetical protein